MLMSVTFSPCSNYPVCTLVNTHFSRFACVPYALLLGTAFVKDRTPTTDNKSVHSGTSSVYVPLTVLC